MHLFRTVLVIAILAASGGLGSASAQQQQGKPPKKPPVINDPSIYRPVPPDRNYVGPAPGIAPPMERIPPVAPLSQPPVR